MRTNRSFACLTAFAAFLAGSAAGADDSRIQLVWVDPSGLVPRAYPEIVSESRKVLQDLGAPLEWRAGRRGEVLGPDSLAVIAVATQPGTPRADRHVMGVTPSESRRPPAVWVYPDQVAWVLGLDLSERASWNKGARRDFVRALARVASHEVAHALGARGHTTKGLMAATLSRRALLAPSLRLDAVTAAALRGTLDGASRLARGAPIDDQRPVNSPVLLSPELASGRARDSNH